MAKKTIKELDERLVKLEAELECQQQGHSYEAIRVVYSSGTALPHGIAVELAKTCSRCGTEAKMFFETKGSRKEAQRELRRLLEWMPVAGGWAFVNCTFSYTAPEDE